jgi:hypothetical protein
MRRVWQQVDLNAIEIRKHASSCLVGCPARPARARLRSACTALLHLARPLAHRWSGDAQQLLKVLPLEASLSNGKTDIGVGVEPTRDGLFQCSYTGRFQCHACTAARVHALPTRGGRAASRETRSNSRHANAMMATVFSCLACMQRPKLVTGASTSPAAASRCHAPPSRCTWSSRRRQRPPSLLRRSRSPRLALLRQAAAAQAAAWGTAAQNPTASHRWEAASWRRCHPRLPCRPPDRRCATK